MEERYLYGAAVQGIQDFIFQTNKLREIIGASELVESICTIEFEKFMGGSIPDYTSSTGFGAIVTAAGNIKYVFDDKEQCQKIVREFPKHVMTIAPGITISQAVVTWDGNKETFEAAVDKLEERLRAQRNKPMRSATLGLMGIQRSRQTGLPAVETEIDKDNIIYRDASTKAKVDNSDVRTKLCEHAFGIANIKANVFAFDIEDITDKNDWVAIIHADGNGLGLIVQKIGNKPEEFRLFSKNLDIATKLAAQDAYKAVENEFNNRKRIPIRPIVLSGDDLTIICRADIAMTYTQAFLRAFQRNTAELLKDTLKEVYSQQYEQGLTACAGIAFVKSSFPFYYGYNLAEELCSFAKKDTKNTPEKKEGTVLPQACLMFHKVQDSFTERYEDIVKRELMPQENISFQFGPYYLETCEDRQTIDWILNTARDLDNKEGNALKSDLRQWMSAMHQNINMAQQRLRRIKVIHGDNDKFVRKIVRTVKENCLDKQIDTYPTYDILAIHTILTQETKNNQEIE